MVYVDPPYPEYNAGKLFDDSDPKLNRDDYLLPYRRSKERLEAGGAQVQTADVLLGEETAKGGEYYSFGHVGNEDAAVARGARLRAFVLFEPPVVAPWLYDALPELTTRFERVYLHNTKGDGYSLSSVDRGRLHKLWWPQQYEDVIERLWGRRDRLEKAVAVNNNKKPRRYENELYSRRIEAVAELAGLGAVDLYGGHWNRWLVRESRFRWGVWRPAFRHRRLLRTVWKGAPPSKFDVLARYAFCLCLENMRMDGFTTEKLFDCLYTGTIPIYLGPRDVQSMVPKEVFIDASRFPTWTEAWEHALSLSPSDQRDMREAGREFVRGEASRPFKDSLVKILSE